jgi:hypothetical protein
MLGFSDGSMTLYAKSQAYLIADRTVGVAGAAGTILGQKDQNLGVMYDDKSIFIDIIKGVIPVSDLTEQLGKAKDAKDKLLEQTTFQEEAKFNDLKFKFLKSEKYGNLDPQEDALPATLAQQDDLLTSLYSLKEWTEKEVNETLPYPGKDLFENFYYSAEKPVNLEKNNLGKDYSNKADSTTTPAAVTLDSLQKYKIQK